jgi:hypothetical protein
MVSFAALVSAISMALLATTISAAPAITEERDWPPPTSSVLDFTLYKETSPGNEGKCWNNVPGGDLHVAPADLVSFNGTAKSTACNKADFYVAHIDTTHPGYNCNGIFLIHVRFPGVIANNGDSLRL